MDRAAAPALLLDQPALRNFLTRADQKTGVASLAAAYPRMTAFRRDFGPRSGGDINMAQQANLHWSKCGCGSQYDVNRFPVTSMACAPGAKSRHVSGIVGVAAPELQRDSAKIVGVRMQIGDPLFRVRAAAAIGFRNIA